MRETISPVATPGENSFQKNLDARLVTELLDQHQTDFKGMYSDEKTAFVENLKVVASTDENPEMRESARRFLEENTTNSTQMSAVEATQDAFKRQN